METNGTQKYDLIEKNYRAIQGLVMERARKLNRETGLSLGRSVIRAEDEVAEKLIVEQIDGPGLGHWLAEQRLRLRNQPVYQESIPPAPAIQQARQFEAQVEPNGLHVNQPIQDEDTFVVRGLASKQRRVDPILVELIAKCKRIQPGEVWSFPCGSIEEAEALSKYMPKVARQLGWRAKFGKRSYRRQVFPDRLKLKRIS